MANHHFQKLKNFGAALKYSSLLDSSIVSLINYYFLDRSLEDVLKECLESDCVEDELKEEIESFIKSFVEDLALSVLAAIKVLNDDDKKLVTTVTEWRLFAESSGKVLLENFASCFVLFDWLTAAKSSSPDFFAQCTRETLDMIEPLILETKRKFEDNMVFKKTLEKILMYKVDHKDCKFPEHRTNKAKARKRKISVSKSFRKSIDELVTNFSRKHFDLFAIEDLSKVLTVEETDQELIKSLYECVYIVNSCENEKVFDSFLDLLQAVVLRSESINETLKNFFSWNMKKFGRLPNFSDYYKKFESGLSNLLNEIINANQFSRKNENFYKIRNEFAWFLFIAPKPTIWIILSQCIENKLVVPNVLRVLRCLPSFLELKLSENNQKEETECSDMIPVIIFTFRKLLTALGEKLKEEEVYGNCVYLLSSFCRGRHGACEVLEEPVVSSEEIILFHILPELFAKNNLKMMLDALCRLLITNAQRSRVVFSWSLDLEDDYTDKMRISAAKLLLLLVDIRSTYDSDGTIDALSLKCLKALGARLQEEKFEFNKEIKAFILKRLNDFCWSLKYTICIWFDTALGSPRLQLTTGLFKALSIDEQKFYDEIVVDFEFSPAECLLKSLFELAIIDSEVAADFFKKGIAVCPLASNLGIKIAIALVNVLMENADIPVEKLKETIAIIKSLIDTFDPPRECIFTSEYTKNTFLGIRDVEPYLLLGEAITYALVMNSDAEHGGLPRQSDSNKLSSVLEKLVILYSQLVKNYFDEQFIDYRRKQRESRTKKETMNQKILVEKHLVINAQLSQVFCYSCVIAQHLDSMPICFCILLSNLTDYQNELQEVILPDFLDHKATNSRKDAVVYAFADQSKCSGSSKNTKKINKTMEHSSGNTSVIEADIDKCVRKFDHLTIRPRRGRRKGRIQENDGGVSPTNATNELFEANIDHGNVNDGTKKELALHDNVRNVNGGRTHVEGQILNVNNSGVERSDQMQREIESKRNGKQSYRKERDYVKNSPRSNQSSTLPTSQDAHSNDTVINREIDGARKQQGHFRQFFSRKKSYNREGFKHPEGFKLKRFQNRNTQPLEESSNIPSNAIFMAGIQQISDQAVSKQLQTKVESGSNTAHTNQKSAKNSSGEGFGGHRNRRGGRSKY